MYMRIREITHFLHTSLYHYPRFESFEDIQSSGIHEWGVLSKETVKQIMVRKEVELARGLKTSSLLTSKVEESERKPEKFGQGASVPYSLLTTNSGGGLRPPEEFGREKVSIFSPRKSDSLFWSMYIAKHGVNEFFEIGTKYMNKEIEEKSKIMEFMKSNRPLLKSMKITSDKGQEIMGDLMTNKKTELTVVCAFALFYQARIWVVSEDSHTYFEFLPYNLDDNTPVFVIHRSNSSGDRRSPSELVVRRLQGTEAPLPKSSGNRLSYTVDTHVLEKTLIHIRDNMVRLESPTMHMKGISNYKITDLEKIINVLGITLPTEITKWKKTDMYNSIRMHCMTAWLNG